ncbi:MAG: hypothetical protein AAGI34_09430 [Pseudomonadota bacterium]
MTTKHPAPAGAQRRAFEQIATGNSSPIMAKTTQDALLRKGLIVELSPLVLPGVIPVTIRRFEVPVPIHMQWCEWCAERGEL